MTERTPDLDRSDALLLVDVQNDFCPGGALAVPEGDRVVPVLNRWIGAARDAGIPVLASRDWHPRNHPSFAGRGGPWPEHCVQDTPGAAFHADLDLDGSETRVTKGVRFDHDQYSAFDATGLAHHLEEAGVERLWIGGLAQDVCVEATVLDACRAGFEVHLITEATRPVDPEAGEQALETMRQAGAVLE